MDNTKDILMHMLRYAIQTRMKVKDITLLDDTLRDLHMRGLFEGSPMLVLCMYCKRLVGMKDGKDIVGVSSTGLSPELCKL